MARAFTAASSHILSLAAAPYSASPLTFACWFYPISAPDFGTLFSLGASGSGGNYRYPRLNGTGIQIVDAGGAGEASATTGNAFTDSAWNHAVAIWASTTDRRITLNGGTQATNATTIAAPSGLNRTDIGGSTRTGAPDGFFNGRIAEAALWTVALSTLDIAVLNAGVSPLLVRPDALVTYWPLLGYASPEIDLIGRNELTVTGATVANHPRLVVPAGQVASASHHYFFITGVTKSSSGVALASCTVKLHRSSDDVLAQTTTSDGSGAYSFIVQDPSVAYYLVAYKVGSPDVAGTTVNTLVGV